MMKQQPADLATTIPTDLMPAHSLLDIFEELTFREKWRRVFHGLRMPHDSGEYKFARLQVVRLSAPLCALLVPLAMLLLIMLLSIVTLDTKTSTGINVLPRPEPKPKLDPVPPPEPDPQIQPDATKVAGPVLSEPKLTVAPRPLAPPVQMPPSSLIVPRMKVAVGLRQLFTGPTPGEVGEGGVPGGGSAATEGAVLRALRWLKQNQGTDGAWEGSSRSAMTALALLTYLAHGETPASDEFGTTVKAAIDYLLSQEQAGRFAHGDGHDYTSTIATYALCEAYALTLVPSLYDAAERGIQRIVQGQCPEGSFAYGLKIGPPAAQDMSYAGWCIQALKVAKVAQIGSTEVDTALARAIAGVRGHYRPSRENSQQGGFAYRMQGGSAGGLTAVGTLCLQLLGEGESAEARAGLAWLSERMPFAWGGDAHRYAQFYYYYYNTQAMFLEGGSGWKRWDAAMAPGLVSHQEVTLAEASGYVDHLGQPQAVGSWEHPGEKHTTGRVMDTCLGTLMLEVYYRQLRSLAPPDGDSGDTLEEGDADIVVEIVALSAPPSGTI
jgi:hypothetical protein